METKTFNIKEIVKDNVANFTHCISAVMYYKIIGTKTWIFPIDMNDKEDVGTATFQSQHKAISLMRYINKAIKNNSLIEI